MSDTVAEGSDDVSCNFVCVGVGVGCNAVQFNLRTAVCVHMHDRPGGAWKTYSEKLYTTAWHDHSVRDLLVSSKNRAKPVKYGRAGEGARLSKFQRVLRTVAAEQHQRTVRL